MTSIIFKGLLHLSSLVHFHCIDRNNKLCPRVSRIQAFSYPLSKTPTKSTPACMCPGSSIHSSSCSFSVSMNRTCVKGKFPFRPLICPSHCPFICISVTNTSSPTCNHNASYYPKEKEVQRSYRVKSNILNLKI